MNELVQTRSTRGAEIHTLTRPKSSETLIVFFSPAVTNRSDKSPPFFAGIDLTRDLNASFLAISDPMLQMNSDLGLAWYAGSKTTALQQILPDLIQETAYELGATRIILTGPSGGGFASLYYGTVIPCSVVLSVNPQTEILRYEKYAVERYATVCHGWDGDSELKETLRPAIQNLPWHYYAGARSNGYVLQNSSDWHVAKHTLPLIWALTCRSGRAGHAAG